jgi:hypothetical protein
MAWRDIYCVYSWRMYPASLAVAQLGNGCGKWNGWRSWLYSSKWRINSVTMSVCVFSAQCYSMTGSHYLSLFDPTFSISIWNDDKWLFCIDVDVWSGTLAWFKLCICDDLDSFLCSAEKVFLFCYWYCHWWLPFILHSLPILVIVDIDDDGLLLVFHLFLFSVEVFDDFSQKYSHYSIEVTVSYILTVCWLLFYWCFISYWYIDCIDETDDDCDTDMLSEVTTVILPLWKATFDEAFSIHFIHHCIFNLIQPVIYWTDWWLAILTEARTMTSSIDD